MISIQIVIVWIFLLTMSPISLRFLTMKQTNLPPKLNTNVPKSLVQKYNEQEQKEGQYCYKPYRNLRNYLQ